MPSDAAKRRYVVVHKDEINARARAKQQRAKAWVNEQKDKPCMDCGGRFPPVCMDFDHRPEENKEFNISLRTRYSKERLLAEMAKCDLVCANCHRIRTHIHRKGEQNQREL